MLGTCLDRVRETTPLVHNITNYVTVNDVANVLLACGGSPIMSDDIQDVEDITSICGGLNINIGTLNQNTIPSMFAAGKKANELGHPVVLDPVGVGASPWRLGQVRDLLDGFTPAILRVNLGEAQALLKVHPSNFKVVGFTQNVEVEELAALADACPLKKETAEKGIDLMMVRELTGGAYFGKRDKYQTEDRGLECTDLMAYSEKEIERVGRRAFELARLRRKKVSSVDKANVLETSRLWRSVMHRLAEEYSDVQYEDVLVDNAAMQLVKNPSQFDVIVTENLFGDILSDEASMITGSIGMMASASLGDGTRGMYEPIHGSAPDIAGRDLANPIGTILSAAMMLRYSFDMDKEADCIEQAVNAVLDAGYRTADCMSEGCTQLSCSAMGEKIREQIC